MKKSHLLIGFICLFVLGFMVRGPELIANNVPIVAKVNGQIFFPALVMPDNYQNRDFFEIEKQFKKKPSYANLKKEGFFAFFSAKYAFLWPIIPRHPNDIPETLDDVPPTPPGMNGRVLGTDELGRDLLVRIIYAARLGVGFSLIITPICWILGVLLGATMGYFGGFFDLAVSRIVELISLFPKFLLLLTLLALLDKPGLTTVGFVFLLSGWIGYQRYVRAEVLRERKQTYAEAARAIGAGRARIIFRHLLPNSIRPTFVIIPFDLADTILALSGLSYLGFGTPPPTADLGDMLNQATQSLPYGWWFAVYPGLALFGLLLLFNSLGELVRRKMPQRRA